MNVTWDEIAEQVQGTCLTEGAIAEKFEVPVDDVLEELLNRNIEICPDCGWWVESHELIDDESELTVCYQCR